MDSQIEGRSGGEPIAVGGGDRHRLTLIGAVGCRQRPAPSAVSVVDHGAHRSAQRNRVAVDVSGEPYMDLTVAAHSLRVIDAVYEWFDTLGASRPDIRLVLHGGDASSPSLTAGVRVPKRP